jgi:DNA-directed RNA polymerase II subunit RPB2
VFVNGNWVGVVPNSEHIANVLRQKRREGLIEYEISIFRDIPQREVGWPR